MPVSAGSRHREYGSAMTSRRLLLRRPGRQSLGARFDSWTKRNFTVVVIVFIALLASSVITIISSISSAGDWYTRTFQWRENEYRKLAGLQAGFSTEKFKSTLGDPLYHVKVSVTGSKLIESIFPGRGYWVDILSDDSDVVLAYSVTSCNREFQPTFRPTMNPSSPITLNKTTFADIPVNGDADTMAFLSGATANSYVYQVIYQGNPSNYRTHAWGLNDACQWFSVKESKGLGASWFAWNASKEGRKFASNKSVGPELRKLLAISAVNTYMETAPNAVDISTDELGIKKFYPQQLGVDRIIVRSYPGQDLIPWTACDAGSDC